MKKLLIIIVVLVLLGSVGYFCFNNYIDNSLKPVDINDNTIMTIEIPSGSSTSKIANILYNNGLINDKRVFKYFAKKEGYDVLLKAGKFDLSKSMDMKKILENLVNKVKSQNTVNFTVIEGLTLTKVAKSLSEQLNLDKDKLLVLMSDVDNFRERHQFLKDNKDIKDLQGYLLPETYNVYEGQDEEQIIDFLLTQFDKYYSTDIVPYLDDTKLSFEEVINLASIIEKEAMIDTDRPIIAGVFINRLNDGMKLQSCATVNYAQGEWKERLSNEDISIDSPYNTYVHEGLPPTPINSPGKNSIEAALHPKKVDYYYFLAKGDGSHYFSVTYEEHLKAKAKYLGR